MWLSQIARHQKLGTTCRKFLRRFRYMTGLPQRYFWWWALTHACMALRLIVPGKSCFGLYLVFTRLLNILCTGCLIYLDVSSFDLTVAIVLWNKKCEKKKKNMEKSSYLTKLKIFKKPFVWCFRKLWGYFNTTKR